MFSTAEAGADMAAESLSNFPRPFDVVVLGMGNDGHTCSWFPCSAELENALTTQACAWRLTQPQRPTAE